MTFKDCQVGQIVKVRGEEGFWRVSLKQWSSQPYAHLVNYIDSSVDVRWLIHLNLAPPLELLALESE